jgi:hypothetical protein
MTPVGLPHSEIPGSKRACRSPRHIAACHVFHRLSVPRHPPSTLSNLTIKCLDLMRSAVPHSFELCCASLSTYPYSIVNETLRSRRPTLGSIRKGDCVHRLSHGRSLRIWCNQKGLAGISAQPCAEGERWWSWTGSNRRPPACKAGALPTELQPRRI